MNIQKTLTIAIAAATLAVGSLAATGQASAKGMHGNHHHFHGHRWYGHRFYANFDGFYDTEPCYFVRGKFGKVVKICPAYDLY